jgi:GNAT superfamily N-acetyltransferase
MIRSMTEEDIPEVTQLIRESFGDESEFYLNYYPVDTYFPMVVAQNEQGIIGAATSYLNHGHPHWFKMMVAVDKNCRRQGIGKQLHEAALQARALEPTLQGLQGYCYKGEDEAENFMKALGHRLRLTCHILELDSTDRDKQGLLEWLPLQKAQQWQILQKPLFR